MVKKRYAVWKHPNSIITRFKKGNIPWCKGKKFPIKKYPNFGMRNKHQTEETRKKIINHHWSKKKGFIHPSKGKHHTKETKELIREARIRNWRDSKYREGQIKKFRQKGTREFGKKELEKRRRRFQELNRNPSFIKKRITGLIKKPNKKELFLDSIIQSNFPNEFLLNIPTNITIIGGMIPDWLNINGQKKVILHHGIYWHLSKIKKEKNKYNLTKQDIEKEDIKYYKKYGFDCLIIWEDELKDEFSLLKKLQNFVKEG